MDKKFFPLLLAIISISVLGVIGMQFYYLTQQYEVQRADTEKRAHEVLRKLDQHLRQELNSRADLDLDKTENLDIYYESPDSSVSFVFESVTKKRNNDGSPHLYNDELLRARIGQFNDFLYGLPPHDSEKVGENFIIIYGQQDLTTPDTKDWGQLAPFLNIDSLLSTFLSESNIHSPFHFAIYNQEASTWDYISAGADTTMVRTSTINSYLLSEDYKIYLLLFSSGASILKSISTNLILSSLLILAVLGALIFMYRVILKQKKISEIKNDFINNMTHEFKTPLATIAFATANIENASNIADPEKVRSFTSVIKNENQRMNKQVEQVLSAAISDKRSFELNYSLIPLNPLLHELTTSLKMKFPQTKYKLVRNDTATSALNLEADPLHLSNAISNILDNAFKYSPEGGRISLHTSHDGDNLEVRIEDEGLGMSNEVQRKIFDKFFRVPTGNIHNIKGFGLGLHYSKAIIEQHGGTLTVRSSLGKGSEFIIHLPIKKKK